MNCAVQEITLLIRGQGHVPSFKNKKRAILDSSTGKMRTLTAPKTKKWMNDCIDSFVLQLLYGSQTTGSGTTPGHSKRSLIVSLLPEDDSRQHIPEMHIYTQEVDRGNEGADITIEALEEATQI